MEHYNDEIAVLFNEIADLLEILGENKFKAIAYRTGARNIQENLEPINKENASIENFKKIPRIGNDLAKKMMEYIETGEIEHLKRLQKEIPKDVRDLIKIPHLGPRRVRELFLNLNIQSKKDLIKAAKNGEIDNLPGFGNKLVHQILEGIESGQEKKKVHERKTIDPIAKKIVKILRKIKEVDQVIIAGSYRRGKSSIGDLDILVSGNPNVKNAEEEVLKLFPDHTTLGAGETKMSFMIFPENLQVDIRFVHEESYGAALLYFTGSKNYNVEMRKIAIQKGYLLNEYGLFEEGEYIAGKTEEEVFERLEMKYEAPEKRR